MKTQTVLCARPGWVRVALWLLLTCAGWGLSQAVPPMQSPDENQHIARAYLLGQGVWGLVAPPGEMSGGAIDAGLTTYIRQYMRLAGHPDLRLRADEQAALRQLTWQGNGARIHFEMPGTGYYLPLVYIPHAATLRMSEELGLRIHTSYQLVRFVVLGCTLALIMWSFSLLGPGMAVAGVLLLPMMVFQLILPTLDGFTTALALVAVGLFARLLQHPGALHAPRWGPAALGMCLLVVVTSRVHLLPMGLFLVVLGLRHRRWSDAAWGIAVLACAAAWLAFAIGNTVDTRIPRDHSTTELLQAYLRAPWDFVTLLANTWLNEDLQQFYGRSFIGILGWLDAPLPNTFYPWIGTGLLLCMWGGLSLSTVATDWVFRATMLMVTLVSLAFIFFALLITWTPHPAQVIAGVQGRYFLVPALLLGYSLHGSYSSPHTPIRAPHAGCALNTLTTVQALRMLFLIIFTMLCMAALVSSLHIRYA